MDRIVELLIEKLPDLHGTQLERLGTFYEHVCKWNEHINLTSVIEPEEAADKHFVDSLLAAPYIPKDARCIDVGTGAGFPGIPLMIARGDIKMTLLDCLLKRVHFLEEVCAGLGLHPQLVHARAEDAGKEPAHREQYDIALCRAVAPLNALLELAAPFVRIGGSVLAYKGKSAHEEAEQAQSAAKLLGCTLSVVELNAEYGVRRLVCAKKMAPTPKRYPRKAGEPVRKPL